MALSHRRPKNDTRLMRDRFIEVSVETISHLNYEAPRREAYLEGFEICRALVTLEDMEIVLAMRWSGCKRGRSRPADCDLRYFWTTEAIGWVAAYLGELRTITQDGAGTMPRPGAMIGRFTLADVALGAFEAAAYLLAAGTAGFAGGALASVLFG